MEEEICRICHQSKSWHLAHTPKHKFVGDEGPLEVQRSDSLAVSKIGDPLLRLTLLHKGVITEGDLAQAEQWVNAARDEGKAVVLLPDEAGQMRYHLVDLNEAMTLKAGR
jgi:hypothetical protein